MNESNLWKYQHTGVNHILDNSHSGLFLDMGLGKTVTTLTAINILQFHEMDISSALIIGPKRVVESVWSAEIEKWDHLKHLKISKIIGPEKKRLEALRQPADIYLVSRDNIAWLCGQFNGGRLPMDMLVIDESSSFKNHKSIRFKALKLAAPYFSRVVILTGTPAPNGLIDLWSQIYLLDRGERLGKTITAYRDNYFKPGKRNGAIIYSYDLQKDGEARIHEQIDDICMSMKAKDYLDLPERTNNYVYIDLPEKIKQQYEDFEAEQVLALLENDKEITAINAAALSNKLLQFANGAVYDENKDWHEFHKEKLDALDEIIENANGKPVLLAWTFRHDQERILEHFKKLKPKQLKTDQDIQDWNAKKIPLMMMHPASGGHGLNLQSGGSIIVWFGQTWSLELYEQFNARLDRQGQIEPVTVHHLVCRGTEDETVIASLARKQSKQDGLMEALKAKIDKYRKKFSK